MTGSGSMPAPNCDQSGIESVTGGTSNRASDLWATVSGGCDNVAGPGSPADGCTVNSHFTGAEAVSGGQGNWASAVQSAVSGGQGNFAQGLFSSIVGGVGNETLNAWGAILGGSHRTLTNAALQAASDAGPTAFAP